MKAIQEIFKIYGPEYLSRYGNQMPRVHKKVISAITECRSGTFGAVIYRCENCGTKHGLPCSCGNRHCPSCQQEKANQWLQKQISKRLPCNYFLLTFTLPEGLRTAARSNQRIVYGAMFKSAYRALKKLAQDKRFLGTAHIGLLAALHTWGRCLHYHPHLHVIVPAGALAEDNQSWLPSRQDLFVHTKPLTVIFKTKIRDALEKAGLADQIDKSVWKQDWVVDSQAVGNVGDSLRYLARYVFRVAISNNRIVSYDNHTVKFRYKDSHCGKWRTMTLDAIEFIRRFLQHVLPTGFMKIRHFGFLNGNSSVPLEKICEMIDMLSDAIRELLPQAVLPKRSMPVCSKCGHEMLFVQFIAPCRHLLSG